MDFVDEILENIKREINELDPAILRVLKEGMAEGEKKVDKIQLDAAKAASVLLQEYLAHLIGRPVTRTEITGKGGGAMNVNIKFELDKKDQNNGTPEDNSHSSVAESAPSES